MVDLILLAVIAACFFGIGYSVRAITHPPIKRDARGRFRKG